MCNELIETMGHILEHHQIILESNCIWLESEVGNLDPVIRCCQSAIERHVTLSLVPNIFGDPRYAFQHVDKMPETRKAAFHSRQIAIAADSSHSAGFNDIQKNSVENRQLV